jgi:hypothetical protein
MANSILCSLYWTTYRAIHLSLDLPGALGPNHPEFPDSCSGITFLPVEDVADVLIDGPHGPLSMTMMMS